MKKLPLCLILFLIALPLWTQNEFDDFAGDTWEENIAEDAVSPEEPKNPAKKKFHIKNRTVEFSFTNFSFGVSNSFIAAEDIFHNPFYILQNINDIIEDPVRIYQDPVSIDMNEFFSGFKFNFYQNIKPFSFNFNWKDKWGFGLDIGHIDIRGNLAVPDTVLRFNETESETFGASGAVFADVGIPVFFHINNLKIKIRPAAYVTLIYTEPSFKYRYQESSNDAGTIMGMTLEVDYSMRIYSILNLDIDPEDMPQHMADNAMDILRDNLGYDFGLSMEYPLMDWLDIGVDMVNIPIPYAAATLNYYLQLNGNFFVDTSHIDIDPESGNFDIDWDKFWHNDEISFVYETEHVKKTINRPFAMLFYANYRPFNSRFLSLIPSLGFSLNRLYPDPLSIEGGLSARFDFINMIITTIGINYNDRIFRNSIDFAFNFRAFELDFGLSTQSVNFSKSLRGAGIGVNFGLKFGW